MSTRDEDGREEREVMALCDRLLDGRLEEEGRRRLEELVLGSRGARKRYTEYMHLNASMRVHSARMGGDSFGAVMEVFEVEPRMKRKGLLWGGWPLGLAAALVIGVCVYGVEAMRSVAKFAFRSGVEVTVEGPAEFEIQGRDRCRLVSGALVVQVPPGAVGFKVETPFARLVDLGTEFSVRMDERGRAAVRVLKGTVEVEHVLGGRLRLEGGEIAVIEGEAASRVDRLEGELRSPEALEGAQVEPTFFNHAMTTAMGQGDAGYVSSPGTARHFSDELLFVKNANTLGYLRKAILRFDLRELGATRLEGARLTFNFERSGIGVPDLGEEVRFGVYGVTDDALDGWTSKGLSWAEFPAFSAEGGGVDLTKAERVGGFTMPRGVSRGVFHVEGEGLVRFLERDGNRLASLILVCETKLSRADSLVYAVAGNHHPTLPPPTLRLRTVR